MDYIKFDLDKFEQEIAKVRETAKEDGIHNMLKDICKRNGDPFSGNSYTALDWADITVLWGSSSNQVEVCWHGIPVFVMENYKGVTRYFKGHWVELLRLLWSNDNIKTTMSIYQSTQEKQREIVETYFSMGSLT